MASPSPPPPVFFSAAFSEALHQQQLATSQTDPHLSSTAASLMGSAAIEQNATGKMGMPARSKFRILYIIPREVNQRYLAVSWDFSMTVRVSVWPLPNPNWQR